MEEEIIINTEVKGANQAEKQLDDLADATNKADDAGVQYEETLGSLASEAQVFGVSLNSMSKAFTSSIAVVKNSVRGLKLFQVALASTGIGLLVIALGSLVAWMKTTEEGTQFLSDVFVAIGVVAQRLTGLLSDLFGAFRSFATGDFSGGINKVTDAFSGLGAEITATVRSATDLNKAIRDLEIRTGLNSVALATYNQRLAENKRASEDVRLTIEERIEANLKAQDNLAQVARVEADLAEARTANARQFLLDQVAGSQARTDARIAYAVIAGEEIDIQTASIERSVELVNAGNTLLLEQQRANVNFLTEIVTAGSDLVIDKTKEEEDAFTASMQKRTEELSDFYDAKKDKAEQDLQLQRQYAQLELAMTADLFGALASLAGQESLAGKALALAQAVINTNLGITNALTIQPVQLVPLAVATAIATGLKAVRDITSTVIPQVSINETSPFGDGGMIYGDSHSARSGGVRILAEGGESVINKRSTRMFKPLLNQINLAGGGVPIMAHGGLIPDSTGFDPFLNLQQALAGTQTVLVLDDLDKAQQSEFVTRVTTTL